ncbi:hypothetical protein F4809DRAFT_388432 [Biscogniauxia mediterranea]|nr:hypothetical protein F4809DRAFT_388432 [Biscogniauxia mediterranea]
MIFLFLFPLTLTNFAKEKHTRHNKIGTEKWPNNRRKKKFSRDFISSHFNILGRVRGIHTTYLLYCMGNWRRCDVTLGFRDWDWGWDSGSGLGVWFGLVWYSFVLPRFAVVYIAIHLYATVVNRSQKKKRKYASICPSLRLGYGYVILERTRKATSRAWKFLGGKI